MGIPRCLHQQGSHPLLSRLDQDVCSRWVSSLAWIQIKDSFRLILYHRWFKYSRYGTPIGDTKIIAVKTPLKQVLIICLPLDPCDQLTNKSLILCRPSTVGDLEGKCCLSA